MDKQYKVIDDRGRLTIPRSVRFLTGITANSIVSLTFSKDEIIIKKEKICDNCQNEKEGKETITLAEFLNQLPEAEQDAALIHLLVERSKKKGGYENVGTNGDRKQRADHPRKSHADADRQTQEPKAPSSCLLSR